MAHFAELDENNIVVRVLVVPDEHEHRGQEFMADDLGLGGTWMQTSYNTRAGSHELGGTAFRGNYAGSGMLYDESLGAFIHGQPFPSWVVNTTTYSWEAPTPYPGDPHEAPFYEWDEDTTSWVEVE